jgi:biopolymer transport protein ExbD
MTSIESPSATNFHRVGVRRMIKHTLKIDMTPMVDLGFLLISFFVITTELSKPTVMHLAMPVDGAPSPLEVSNALTIIPDGGNTIWYYFGKWEDAEKAGAIYKTEYAGNNSIRKVIGDKQQQLDNNVKSKEKRDGLMLLIKPTAQASYKNLVDVLDEATINIVKKYAVLKLSKEEMEWLKMRQP